MSSDQYENSTVSVNPGCVEAAADERLERTHDVDDEEAYVFMGRRDGGEQPKTRLPAAERTFFNAASLTLGLIVVVSLVGILFKIVVKDKECCTVEIAKLKNDSANQTEGLKLCPSNWTRFRCNCYFTSTETRNWTESRRDCESRGAELVVKQNKEEQDFIKEKLQRRGDSWIGLQAVTKEWREEWQWVDGNPIKYTSWKAGVSVTPVKHHKVYITEKGEWIHTNNGSRYWICQRPIF